MASWGVYTALAGFEYHGPAGRIGFAPRVTPEDFKTAFTAAEGWGTYSQKVTGGKHTSHLKLAWGQVESEANPNKDGFDRPASPFAMVGGPLLHNPRSKLGSQPSI